MSRLFPLVLLVALGGCHLLFPFDTAPGPDGARLDTSTNGPKPDGPKPDGPKPDGPRPDGPKPDGEVQVVSIAKGTFTMGSPSTEPCRFTTEDPHQVTLTHNFEMLATEVTQGQFSSLMGYNPSWFGPGGMGGAGCGTTCPVEQVTWHEATAYCNALSSKAGKTACYTCSGIGKDVTCEEAAAFSDKQVYSCPGYRLPTEAEWEYAYRATATTAYYNGSNDNTKCNTCTDVTAAAIAWHKCNAASPHPTMQMQANAWGLYDMAGNVMEWCHDKYQNNLGPSPVIDPVGSAATPIRVYRGGSWGNGAGSLRAASRAGGDGEQRNQQIGFRCARTATP